MDYTNHILPLRDISHISLIWNIVSLLDEMRQAGKSTSKPKAISFIKQRN